MFDDWPRWRRPSGPGRRWPGRSPFCRAPSRLSPAPPRPSATCCSRDTAARLTLGYQAAVQPLRAAVTALLADDLDPAVGLRWLPLGTAAAGILWDDQATCELSDRWVDMARAAGALSTLPVALAFHAVSDAMTGHFREADTRWARMLGVLTDSREPFAVRTRRREPLAGARGYTTWTFSSSRWSVGGAFTHQLLAFCWPLTRAQVANAARTRRSLVFACRQASSGLSARVQGR